MILDKMKSFLLRWWEARQNVSEKNSEANSEETEKH